MSEALDRLKAALADRYTVERELGRGGMAVVYLAQDLRHERPVAIKVLRPELTSVVAAERFLREIKLTAALAHPHVLPLLDSGEADSLLYYVMPYVEGESLRVRLDREKQLPVDEAVRIAREVADALSYAHDQRLLHRDIKPENILLQAGHAVVADFGIARALTEAAGDRLTDTGVSIGTPAYMSPEQASGDHDLDACSDVYALGCVLYEMLTGEPPFSGRSPQAVIARHISERPPSLRAVRPAIPAPLERVVHTALSKARADRFSTAEVFSQALSAYPQPGFKERRIPRSTKRWSIAVAGTVMVAITAAALAKFVALGPSEELQPVPSQPVAAAVGLRPTRIAVLYFDDLSEAGDLDYLVEGFTETLIQQLAQVEALEVLSRNAVKPFRGSDVLLDSIVHRLQVGTLVEGSIMASGDRVRVNVQLIDAVNLAYIESAVVEGVLGNPLDVLERLATEVSDLLRTRLGREVTLRKLRGDTQSAEAWTLRQRAALVYQDARSFWGAGDTAAAARAYERADYLFAQAEAADPTWGNPIVARGWISADKARLYETMPKAFNREWIAEGLGHAERALDLNPGSPDALELRGTLYFYLWQTADSSDGPALREAAEEDLLAAVAADSSRAYSWRMLSEIHRISGQFQEAKLVAERAYQADEFLSGAMHVVFQLCAISLDLEELEDADRWCAEGRRRFPDSPAFVEARLILLATDGGPEPDPEQAWALARAREELSPPARRPGLRSTGLMDVAAVLARAGLEDSARAIIAQARELDTRNDPYVDYTEANARLHLDERDSALRLLGEYLAARPDRRAYIAKDPWFRVLRDDPHFRALVGGN